MAVTATSCQNGRKQPTWLKPQPGAPAPRFHLLRSTNRVPCRNSPEAFEFPVYLRLVSSAILAPKWLLGGEHPRAPASYPPTSVSPPFDAWMRYWMECIARSHAGL